jgi:hypothetical protein
MERTRSSAFEEMVNDLRERGLIARLSQGNLVHGGVDEVGEGIGRRILNGAFVITQKGNEFDASINLPGRQIPVEFVGKPEEVTDWVVKQLKPK